LDRAGQGVVKLSTRFLGVYAKKRQWKLRETGVQPCPTRNGGEIDTARYGERNENKRSTFSEMFTQTSKPIMTRGNLMNCKAHTTNGQPCQAQALTDSRYCFVHDPTQGAARAKARKRGGERRRVPHMGNPEIIPTQVRTIDDVLKVLDYALAESMPLENSIQRGRLLVAIAGAFIEAIKTGELESRLAAIEAALKLREAKS